MTKEEAIKQIEAFRTCMIVDNAEPYVVEALNLAVEALEQEPIDKSAMMYEIYMNGVNMIGEFQGCWVRFKDIKKIVDKYMAEGKGKE